MNGNTAGNLYNGGLFCEYDGTVYFSNPSDGGKLYSMSPDGSNLAKLCDDTVSYINADEHYLYYVRNNPGATGAALSFLSVNTDSLCRIDREGGDDSVLILDSAPCLYASLYGNYIYYIRYDESEGSTLYKVKIDGSGCKQVDTAPDFTCSANGEYMYYNGTDSDHYIWRLNTTDDSKGMLYGGNCYMPTVIDDTTAYFMDCDSNYAIARTDLATGEEDTSVRGPRGLVQPLRGLYLLPEKRFRTSVSRIHVHGRQRLHHTVRGKFQGHYNHFRICILP